MTMARPPISTRRATASSAFMEATSSRCGLPRCRLLCAVGHGGAHESRFANALAHTGISLTGFDLSEQVQRNGIAFPPFPGQIDVAPFGVAMSLPGQRWKLMRLHTS